jgi:acid phosphatase type 7
MKFNVGNLFALKNVGRALAVSACLLTPCAWADNQNEVFVVKPYLQLGDHQHLSKPEKLDVYWFARGNKDKWRVESRSEDTKAWKKNDAPILSVVENSVPEKVYSFDATINGLTPGKPFEYRVLKNGDEVFKEKAMARKHEHQSFRFVAFGDMGANSEGQKKVAFQIYQNKPDFTVFLGDIVYFNGLLTEYYEKFFPIYTTPTPSPQTGAPILSESTCFGVMGNHDIALSDPKCKDGIDLNKYGDNGLAFYKVWSEPLNGPLTDWHQASTPKLIGSDEKIKQYTDSTGKKFPRMANYSYDYGNSHWLVLDANPYMDWTNDALRKWVEQDLASAKNAKWKFVCFHQPGFSFDAAHFKEQRMRLLSDIFEKTGVDVVFAGHAHDYQRSFPLQYTPKTNDSGKLYMNSDGTVDGALKIDSAYEGNKDSHPKGIIYLVSGGGGAKLYGSIKEKDPSIKQEFTDKFVSNTYSFTLCDLNGDLLDVKQISGDGNTIDEFKIDKSVGVQDHGHK